MILDTRRNIRLYLILLATLMPIYSVVGQDEWIWYRGHDFEFEYPPSWGLVDNPTGVVLGDNQTFALSIVMHKEGCYSLLQHPQLMDLMLKLWSKQMDGTPDGDPITQYVETSIGPYSMCSQMYKNPDQFLSCEIQGYTAKNVTVTRALATWNPHDPVGGQVMLDFARLLKSLNITLSGNHTSFI